MPEFEMHDQHVDFIFSILEQEDSVLGVLPDPEDLEKAHVAERIGRSLRAMLVDHLGVRPEAAKAAYDDATERIYADRQFCKTLEGEF